MSEPPPNNSQLLIYQTEDGRTKLDVIFESETGWLTQKALADLFGVHLPGITKHLKTSTTPANYAGRQLLPKWKWFAKRASAR